MMHLVQIYLSDSSRAFNVDTWQQLWATRDAPTALVKGTRRGSKIPSIDIPFYPPPWMDSREHFLFSLVDKLSIKCVTNTRVKSTLKIKVMVSFELVRIFTISDIFRFN